MKILLNTMGLFEILLLTFSMNTANKANHEYCETEDFEATCENGLILMQTAEYGRMRPGRCISAGFDYGCSINVRSYFDKKCSGRSHCNVYVSVPELAKQQPCDKNLVRYLEATYKCIPTATSSLEQCLRYKALPLRPSNGYISSDVTVKQPEVGTASCPWIVKVPSGQKIKLTLFLFGKGKMTETDITGEEMHGHSDGCYELGVITEEEKETRLSPCGMGNTREHMVYESASNQLQISLRPGHELATIWPFVIKYEATGCPHLKAPKGAYVDGDTQNAVVRCNVSGETWYLTCGKNGWIGVVGNCSKDTKSTPSNGSNFLNMGGDEFPIGILLIVALGVALGVFLGGILLTVAAVHMKKKQRKNKAAQQSDDLYNTFQRCPMQGNNDKINITHQPYYDIDNFTMQGEYGLNSDCPTHGHKHRTLPQSVMHADLITSHHEPDVNQQYEPTMHNNVTRHSHLYEKTQQQTGARLGT